jgi:hypothetical protein
MDPDPDSQCGSGSTKSLNPDPIRIRIHNPGSDKREPKRFCPRELLPVSRADFDNDVSVIVEGNQTEIYRTLFNFTLFYCPNFQYLSFLEISKPVANIPANTFSY